MSHRFLSLLLVAAMALPSLAQQETLKREMRTVWIATVANIDWPQTRGTGATVIAKQKKQLTDMLDGFVATNMNSVCLQVRPMADALYKSSYEPWSAYLTGTRGQDPGWDPLAFAVEQCHKRGLECNVWINPYRFSNSSGTDCTTPQDVALKNSGTLMTVGKRVVFNPGLESSRQHLLKVLKEIVTNYNIDGIIFDDYFYPGGGTPTDSTAPDYALWQQSGTTMSIGDWRRANVNLMVKEVSEMVAQTKPYVKFSIGPAGVAGTKKAVAESHGVDPCPVASDWQYDQIYSDPLAWLEAGTIDYISPQLYWKTTHSTNPFGPLTKWWSYVAKHFGRHCYPSQNIYFMASTNTQSDWAEIAKQISLTREYNQDGAPGVNFYSAKYINGPTCTGLGSYLKANVFPHKALEPAMTWKPKTTLAAPAGLKRSGNTLTWDATEGNNGLLRYAVYAIPASLDVQEAASSAYGGIKADYLIDVTYTPSFNLPDSVASDHYYAVTVVDGWNNEFAPSYLNPTKLDPAPVTQLLSPADGASFDDDFTFTATEVGADRYELQVATDSTFSTIRHKATMTAADGVLTAPMQVALLGKGTFCWRVVTAKDGFAQAKSAVRSFTVTKVATGNYEPGYVVKKDIDTYADTADFSLTNLWVRSVKSEYANLTQDGQGLMNRSMAALGGIVYLSGRTAGSSNAGAYLAEYDAATGEHLKDLKLGDEASVAYYPCNDVMTDDAGHLVVSNLLLNIGTTPLCIFQVDTATGAVTKRAELTTDLITTKPRIDHCGILGNVATGNFTVFASFSYGTQLCRWTVTDGTVTETKAVTLQAFSPASATSVGIASRVIPLSRDEVIVNGGGSWPTRYNFATGAITGSLADATALLGAGTQSNGAAVFSLGGKQYLLYPSGDYTTEAGFQWTLAQNATASTDFSGLQPLFTFPKQGIGSVSNSTWDAPCVTLPGGTEGTRLLYVYAPGNGLAAYELAPATLQGDLNGDGKVDVADVTALVTMLLTGNTQPGADLSADGRIDASDVTTLVNLILAQ